MENKTSIFCESKRLNSISKFNEILDDIKKIKNDDYINYVLEGLTDSSKKKHGLIIADFWDETGKWRQGIRDAVKSENCNFTNNKIDFSNLPKDIKFDLIEFNEDTTKFALNPSSSSEFIHKNYCIIIIEFEIKLSENIIFSTSI